MNYLCTTYILTVGHKQSDDFTELQVLEVMAMLTEVSVQMSSFKLAYPWVTHHQHYQQLPNKKLWMCIHQLRKLELPYMVILRYFFLLLLSCHCWFLKLTLALSVHSSITSSFSQLTVDALLLFHLYGVHKLNNINMRNESTQQPISLSPYKTRYQAFAFWWVSSITFLI